MSEARLHPERSDLGAAGLYALASAAALSMGIAGGLVARRGAIPPLAGFVLAAACGLLAIAGLPSLPIRTVGRAVAVVSVLMVMRFGALEGPPRLDACLIAVWVASLVGLLVLVDQVPRRVGSDGPPIEVDLRASARAIATRIGVVTLVLLVAVALLAPLIRTSGPSASAGGRPEGPSGRRSQPLGVARSLDMTQRPRLGDAVVMRVRTDHATFWRTGTFDEWDGRTWTQTRWSMRAAPGGDLDPRPDELGAGGSDVITQRITLEAPSAAVLPMAPTAVSVEAPGRVVQLDDGTVLPEAPLGPGARYTVESRRAPLTESVLRATDGPVPDAVAERYAGAPVTTDRVRDAARRATAGVTSTYDQVRALEAWMAARARYSIDAPTAPAGVDVVDHFLFTSREGWCEQIASSLVVLARSLGIPARLAVGYVPGETDVLSGETVVRERQAHAWAEVWFPDVGWVQFDPTADVPLAGQDEIDRWTDGILVGVLLAVGALAVVALLAVVARWLLRRRSRRRHLASSPAIGIEADLVRLGERAGRPRGPGETASAHAADLAVHVGAADLAEVGRLVDDAIYGADPPEAERWDRARAVLAHAATAGDP